MFFKKKSISFELIQIWLFPSTLSYDYLVIDNFIPAYNHITEAQSGSTIELIIQFEERKNEASDSLLEQNLLPEFWRFSPT